jgi:hypothetical protein
MMRGIAVFATTALLLCICCADNAQGMDVANKNTDIVVEENTETYEYYYSYPVEAAAIPNLVTWMKADSAKSRAEIIGWAKQGFDEAKADKREFQPYSQSTGWTVAGSTPQLLSLMSEFGGDTGGAHGNYGFGTLLWDKAAAKALKQPSDVFVKGVAALNIVRKTYCTALDKERAARNGPDWNADLGSIFGDCPAFKDLTIGFSGKQGGQLDTLHFIAAPYVAGSYAEGAYEIELPINPTLLARVKPQYRASFLGR